MIIRTMASYIIGFTGTRNGMTDPQKAKVHEELQSILAYVKAMPHEYTFLDARAMHGDCVGADADFHHICKREGMTILIRPCTYESMRARCNGIRIAKAKDPMQRNKDIVADADILIATPPTHEEVRRSGTWATVRYMTKAQKPLIIIFPDGSVERRNGSPALLAEENTHES